MNGPWDSYAPGTPESKSENWTQRVDEAGQPYWSYLGGGSSAPPTDYGQGYATEPVGGNDSYSAYTYVPPASTPPEGYVAPVGTPGTGSGIPNAYDPSQVAAGEMAAYETLLANGGIPLVGGAPAAPTDPYAAPAAAPAYAADPYAAPAAATDPYTGLPVYEPAYSVSEPYSAPGGYGDPSFGATYPYPSFGQSAMNPGRQQPVVPGQFDPFAWSGNPNPMPAPNETRQMILGAMQLGAEIEQQRAQQPVMTAQNYALHRLGLTKPEEPTPQMPVAPPPRSRFGL